MQNPVEAKSGGLLRVLFLREHAVSADSGSATGRSASVLLLEPYCSVKIAGPATDGAVELGRFELLSGQPYERQPDCHCRHSATIRRAALFGIGRGARSRRASLRHCWGGCDALPKTARTPSASRNGLLLVARRCGRHDGRPGDLPMGGGLSPFHSRGAVIPRRNDRTKGEAEAVARLGANPYDRDGRFLHSDDHGLLCGQRAEFATMAGTASHRLLGFTDSSRDTDLAQRTASPSLGALSIERHAFQTGPLPAEALLVGQGKTTSVWPPTRDFKDGGCATDALSGSVFRAVSGLATKIAASGISRPLASDSPRPRPRKPALPHPLRPSQ